MLWKFFSSCNTYQIEIGIGDKRIYLTNKCREKRWREWRREKRDKRKRKYSQKGQKYCEINKDCAKCVYYHSLGEKTNSFIVSNQRGKSTAKKKVLKKSETWKQDKFISSENKEPQVLRFISSWGSFIMQVLIKLYSFKPLNFISTHLGFFQLFFQMAQVSNRAVRFNRTERRSKYLPDSVTFNSLTFINH